MLSVGSAFSRGAAPRPEVAADGDPPGLPRPGDSRRRLPANLARLGAIAILVLSTTAFAAPAAEPACQATAEAVVDTVESLIGADNREDLEDVLAHYTTQPVLLPPSGEVVQGRDAIAARYRKLFEENVVQFGIDLDEAVVGCDASSFVRGTTTGRLTPAAGGATKRVASTFLMILRCEGGQWRVHRLSWTDRQPAEDGSANGDHR